MQFAPNPKHNKASRAIILTCPNCGWMPNVVNDNDPYRCPTCRCRYIPQRAHLFGVEYCGHIVNGTCHGHPKMPDGAYVRTSSVLKRNDSFILTYNTIYTVHTEPYYEPPVVAESNVDEGSGD